MSVVPSKIFYLIVHLFVFANIGFCQSKLFKSVDTVSKYIANSSTYPLSSYPENFSFADSIYLLALKYCDSDYSEALLSSCFAVLPYNKVPIKIPILGLRYDFPLVSSDAETFVRKNNNIPKILFLDTPNSKFGDKDKLAHFFGAAFISYNTNSIVLTNYIGYLVEVFEEVFVAELVDNRDIRTNYFGACFGRELRRNPQILPSTLFKLYFFNCIKLGL